MKSSESEESKDLQSWEAFERKFYRASKKGKVEEPFFF